MTEHDLQQELQAWMQGEASEPPATDLRERVRSIAASGEPRPVLPLPTRWFGSLAMARAAAIVLLMAVGLLLTSQRPDDQGAVVPGAVETDGGRASHSEQAVPKETEMRLTSPLAAATMATALSASVATAQAPGVPAEFSGDLDYVGGAGPAVDGTTYYQYRTSEMTDPRFEGEAVLAVRLQYLADYGQSLWHGSFRIENDGGAWQEQPHLTLEFADGSASAHTTALIGEGGYEGLTAFTEFDYTPAGHFDLRGVIVEAAVPEPPVLQTTAEATLAGDE